MLHQGEGTRTRAVHAVKSQITADAYLIVLTKLVGAVKSQIMADAHLVVLTKMVGAVKSQVTADARLGINRVKHEWH